MEDLLLVGKVPDPLGLGRNQILGKRLILGKGIVLGRSQILGKDHGLGGSLGRDQGLGRSLILDFGQGNGFCLGAIGTCPWVSEVGKVQMLLWGRFFLLHLYSKDVGVLILNHLKTVHYFPGPIWTPSMNHPRPGKVGNTVQVHIRCFRAPIWIPAMHRPGLGRVGKLWSGNH